MAIFNVLFEDTLLGVKYDLYEALDLGVVSQHPSDAGMLMMNDRMVKKAPAGVNPIQFFAEWLRMDGQSTLDIIRQRLGRDVNEVLDVATPDQDAVRLIEFMRSHERGGDLFYSSSKSSRVFIADNGEEYQLGNSEKSWIKTLVEDSELRQLAMERYNNIKE
jgi:hypothetical protein